MVTILPKGSAGYALRLRMYQRSRFAASTLARRGAYSRSLWAGDAETGVTIMQDGCRERIPATCCMKLACPITAEDTSGSLYVISWLSGAGVSAPH